MDLTILQFAKFRLWKDLDENWDTFTENALVRHLVYAPNEEFVDPVAREEESDLDALIAQLPVPADSSQAEAVSDAAVGRTFVLEGPPGRREITDDYQSACSLDRAREESALRR